MGLVITLAYYKGSRFWKTIYIFNNEIVFQNKVCPVVKSTKTWFGKEATICVTLGCSILLAYYCEEWGLGIFSINTMFIWGQVYSFESRKFENFNFDTKLSLTHLWLLI